MSDGINSFYKAVKTETSLTSERIPREDIIRELFNFKNMNGEFLQRRFGRFQKDCGKLGWNHLDDLSIGVVKI